MIPQFLLYLSIFHPTAVSKSLNHTNGTLTLYAANNSSDFSVLDVADNSKYLFTNGDATCRNNCSLLLELNNDHLHTSSDSSREDNLLSNRTSHTFEEKDNIINNDLIGNDANVDLFIDDYENETDFLSVLDSSTEKNQSDYSVISDMSDNNELNGTHSETHIYHSEINSDDNDIISSLWNSSENFDSHQESNSSNSTLDLNSETFLGKSAEISHASEENVTVEYEPRIRGRSADLDGILENSLESTAVVKRSGPVSRLPVLPPPPQAENSLEEDNKFQSNITQEEMREIILQMRSARAAKVKFESDNTETCSTPDDSPENCVPIQECKYVLETYKKQTPTICSFRNDMPIVCCPRPSMYRNLEFPGCGRRVIRGIRPAARIIPEFALPRPPTDRISPSGIIAGGREAQAGAWPWMAGIYVMNFGVENYLCGATLINERYLVTAAHCFQTSGNGNVIPSRYAIRLGSILVREGKQHLVESIRVHPQYALKNYYFDIAIIKMRTPVDPKDPLESSVKPICLPTREEFQGKRLAGRDVTVTGWGDQDFGGKRGEVLREVTVQVIEIPTCRKAFGPLNGKPPIDRGITSQFICGGAPGGGKDACQRDSGGPLMLLEKGVWFLVGIVSFGINCGHEDYPGVYTRVTNYLDWLEEVAFSN